MLGIADRIAIYELLALYGHILDEKQWSRLGECFVDDAVYDASDFGEGVTHGLAELRQRWLLSTSHPLAHHLTNILVWEDSEGVVRAQSKAIGIGFKGRAGSAVYHDSMRLTDSGWRISTRTTKMRRPPTLPDGLIDS
jgi:hypothetical protein